MTERDWKLEYEAQKARTQTAELRGDRYLSQLEGLRLDHECAVALANAWWTALREIAELVDLEVGKSMAADLPGKVKEALQGERVSNDS
jgi:hypothetical protein